MARAHLTRQEEKVMQHRKFAFLFPSLALAVAVGCANPPGTVEKKSESTTETAQGKVETTKESKQVGTTLEAKTETKSGTPEGTLKTKTETYIGTVTSYTPGKKIVVMTGDKTTHSFDLDEKNLVPSVDGAIAIGSRVKLVEEKGEQTHRITVTKEG
jgi:hypothetical protein